ncbi:MAG: nucleoside hydrolase [Ignisphaera sp.]
MARHFIIDCDTAEDDVMSLILLLYNNISVEGITIVEGNINFDQEVNTMLYVLEFLGREDIKVFPGSRRPLIKSFRTVEEVHGVSGIGDELVKPRKLKAQNKHAVDAIIDLSKQFEGELEFLAISPLTNLALAYLKDNEIVDRIRALYIMGGTIYGRGNVTPIAEFNFWVDPDAAKVVLNAGFKNVIVVPWEVAVENPINDEVWNKIKRMNTKLSQFYIKIYTHYRDFSSKVEGINGHPHPDVITTAIAIDKSIIKRFKDENVDVENCDCQSRGATIIDYEGPGHKRTKEPNARVVYEINFDKFLELLFRTLSSE